jgi:hypothetical protein
LGSTYLLLKFEILPADGAVGVLVQHGLIHVHSGNNLNSHCVNCRGCGSVFFFIKIQIRHFQKVLDPDPKGSEGEILQQMIKIHLYICNIFALSLVVKKVNIPFMRKNSKKLKI